MSRKTLGLMFLIGVLVCGFGCGIAFAQFSSFEYAGDRVIGGDETEEKTIVKKISEKGEIVLSGVITGDEVNIVEDESVPMDEIAFDIVYDPSLIEPAVGTDGYTYTEYSSDYLMTDSGDENDLNDDGYEYFYIYGYKGDDMQYFFQAKDQILKDLKNRKIGSYHVEEIHDVVVRINPANADRIRY